MIFLEAKVLNSDTRLLLVGLSVLLDVLWSAFSLTCDRIEALSNVNVAAWRLEAGRWQFWVEVYGGKSAHF